MLSNRYSTMFHSVRIISKLPPFGMKLTMSIVYAFSKFTTTFHLVEQEMQLWMVRHTILHTSASTSTMMYWIRRGLSAYTYIKYIHKMRSSIFPLIVQFYSFSFLNCEWVFFFLIFNSNWSYVILLMGKGKYYRFSFVNKKMMNASC